MAIADLLNNEQQNQISELLIRILTHGAGRLEVIVEKGQVRWLHPYARTYNPRASFSNRITVQTLDILLGEWAGPLEQHLASVMGAGWGRVVVMVEHQKIAAIESAPDVRACSVRSDAKARGVTFDSGAT